jgi:acyl-CoA synthetase (AMP-forming)/AMP-acid ligase II
VNADTSSSRDRATNLASLLLDHPFADDAALLHDARTGTVVTAGKARAAVHAMSTKVRSIDLGTGDAVAVQLDDSPRLVTTMFGIWDAGCVFVPVNPRYPAAEVERVVRATQPAAILDRDGLRRLDGDARTYDEGVAFVLWTSGTTGAPKPILHTHAAYVELLDRVLGPLRGTARDDAAANRAAPAPNLIPVGLSLNAGIYNVLFGLRAGAPIVVLGPFTTTGFAAAVRHYAIKSTVLPPAAIAMLAADTEVTELTPLKYVRSITAPLSPKVAQRFTARFGAFVLNGYGQAEVGEVIGWTAADAREHADKLGAAGRPHPGVELRLADVDFDGVGKLFVKPPAMAAGTATDEGDALAARLDPDGFFDTGDLARLDADGFVWIEGRQSDVINRGGNKVFPEEVEDVLRTVAGVIDAAVVARGDERLGEVPVAIVVTREEGIPSMAELERACRSDLAPYKIPVEFRHAPSLPRNDAGKLLRNEIKTWWT